MLPFSEITSEWFSGVFGEPTPVQKEAWPRIAEGRDTLVSAPTGTGKTLSAFLVFIDRLSELARRGELKPQLYLIYVSPLKSLAGDIRENLRKPLDGVAQAERRRLEADTITLPPDTEQRQRVAHGRAYYDLPGASQIMVGVRTGDTSQADRRAMFKNPPHILITTPESLYILLTSLSGVRLLHTANAIIIDELHALIDSKRGSHLMFSIARLDRLCGKPLQRIGLSATIEPLEKAAEYLSADGAAIVAPKSGKAIELSVKSAMPESGVLPHGTIWPEIANEVFAACEGNRCVIAFVESRMHAEKLAYYVNMIAGEGFALTHHGSVSKERRMEAEQALREGRLRLLCATSSMELGIDVGDIDRVIQIGCPRTVSSTLQRLGRAGHNPGRVSVMKIIPRTPAEGLSCGITAELARNAVLEPANPPLGCLDVMAQHLVSMSAAGEFTVEDVRAIAARAYPFAGVTDAQIEKVLEMLAGDYEHDRDIPVRPRLLYDRINGRARGDAYSRMLALSAGGTIPDRGLFAVRGENGVRYGEVDEEFVFEARVGDKFLLGAFAWRILSIGHDEIVVSQSGTEGVQPPFWKGEVGGRALRTGLEYGKIMRGLSEAAVYLKDETESAGGVFSRYENWKPDKLDEALYKLGLDRVAADGAKGVILRQIEATGSLPDDRTIIVEHFQNEAAENQMVIHSVFGRRINQPLALLARESARHILGADVGVYDDDEGFLLFPIGGKVLPDGLLYTVEPESAAKILGALLPSTPLFSMTFRYNAARALMMGVRKKGRQPLWIQRQRGARLLDRFIREEGHPLIEETKRDCVENYWDLAGLLYVLNAIRSGGIAIKEVHSNKPSPLSLPLRRAVESELMYDYTPTAPGVVDLTRQAVSAAIASGKAIAPDRGELDEASKRGRNSSDEHQLHALLMAEGDQLAGEIDAPVEWLEELAQAGRALYIEPGLWIAAEHAGEYAAISITDGDDASASPESVLAARKHIVRRALRYHGGHSEDQLSDRYSWPVSLAASILNALEAGGDAVCDDGVYYHSEVYEYARRRTVLARRSLIKTQPPEKYAALLAWRSAQFTGAPAERLLGALKSLCGYSFPAAVWESVILPGRTAGYRPEMLDAALARGEIFWKIGEGSELEFHPYEDMDWDSQNPVYQDYHVNRDYPGNAGDPEKPLNPAGGASELSENERTLYNLLKTRGAMFSQGMTAALGGVSPYDALLSLVGKGLVRSDSFMPVRRLLDNDKVQGASVRQRAQAKAQFLTSGRWELSRGVKAPPVEEQIRRAFENALILSRETAHRLPWLRALEVLRIWEYTGQVRRGYYVEGLSGAQFVREEDFAFVTAALARADSPIIWLPAQDPAQPWGKSLQHLPGRAFMNLPGTVVGLRGGLPIMVFEKQGQTLRVLGEAAGAEILTEALKLFCEHYCRRRFYGSKSSLIVKQFPAEAEAALTGAGFTRYIQDYVYYRK